MHRRLYLSADEKRGSGQSARQPANGADEADALRQYALRLFESCRYAEAADCAHHVCELSPADSESFNMVRFLRAAGRVTEAVWAFRRCLTLQPDHTTAWSNLGNAFVQLRRIETSPACHQRAVALSPRNPRSRHNLGLALMLADRHGDAVRELEQALEILPGEPRFRCDLGRAHLFLGDYVRGWADYDLDRLSAYG